MCPLRDPCLMLCLRQGLWPQGLGSGRSPVPALGLSSRSGKSQEASIAVDPRTRSAGMDSPQEAG